MSTPESLQQNPDLFNINGVKPLSEQEIQTMFDDDFFRALESNDPREKIYMQESGGKVYFSRPNLNKNEVRQIGPGKRFDEKFSVTKEQWEQLKNTRNAQLNTQQVINEATVNEQQLHENVQTTSYQQNIGNEVPESVGANIEALTDELLDWFEEFQKHPPKPKRAGESQKTKERLKEVVKNDIKYLKAIKRDLKKYTYTYTPEIFQRDLDELSRHRQVLTDVRARIIRGDDSSDIPTILGSLKDIKRADKFENKMVKYNKEVNELLKDATLKRLWNEDMEGFQDYLESVWSGEIENPAQHPFFTRHKQDFQYISMINPTLYTTLTTRISTNQRPRRHQDQSVYRSNGQCVPVVACQGRRKGNCETFGKKAGKDIVDLLESLGANKDHDPRKREAWEKIGGVVAVGGALFMGFKFLQNLFSKNKITYDKDGKVQENKWLKAAGRGAGLLALLNYDKVMNFAKDATGWHPEEKSSMKRQMEKYGYNQTEYNNLYRYYQGPSMYVLNTLSDIPASDIIEAEILQSGVDGLTFNYDNYKNYINRLPSSVYTQEWKNDALADAKKLSQDPDLLAAGLAALGINGIESLHKIQDEGTGKMKDSEYVQDNYTQYVEGLVSGIGTDLYKEGLKIKPEYVIIITSDLRNPDNENKKEELIIQWIKSGYLDFVDQDKNYKLMEIINDPSVDLENKTMIGFTNSGGTHIKFDSYEELFDTVNLTNRIKKNFKGNPANSTRPFHISALGRIEFDNTSWYEVWKNETDVVKRRTIKNTSSLLNKNKEFYINYLNDWWTIDGKEPVGEKIDLTPYPILKAMGIDFYNQTEAINTEKWLEEVKESRKLYVGYGLGKTYSIKRKPQVLGYCLVFLSVNEEEYVFTENIYKEFPTLMKNKNTFLNFMNDPNNGMNGSAISTTS